MAAERTVATSIPPLTLLDKYESPYQLVDRNLLTVERAAKLADVGSNDLYRVREIAHFILESTKATLHGTDNLLHGT